MFNSKEYGSQVKKRRRELGLTAADLKVKVENISGSFYERNFIYQIEAARRTITAEQFMALNYALWGQNLPKHIGVWCLNGDQLTEFIVANV